MLVLFLNDKLEVLFDLSPLHTKFPSGIKCSFSVSTYIQQEAHHISLPTQRRLMQGSARFGLPVDVDTGLDQQSIKKGQNE